MSDAPTAPEGDPPPEPDPEPEETNESVKDPAKVLSDNRRLGKEAAQTRKALKEAEAKIEEMTKANMSEVERAIAEAEARGEERGRSELLPLVRDLRFSQAAVGRMAEPDLAGQLLPTDIDLDDHEAIVAAIDALVERHPSLAANGVPHTPAFEQGPRGNGETPAPTMNDVLMDAIGVRQQRR